MATPHDNPRRISVGRCVLRARDSEAGLALGAQVETGTWFVNRCDYLDPAPA